MKSLLNKRLPGILAVGLVALAVGAAGATSSASTNNASDKSGASISGLSSTQKKAKAKAIKKCKKIKNAKKRKACIKKVNKRYANIKPTGKTVVVEVDDDFYNPSLVNLKVNDSIRWDWKNADGREPHNVALTDGPTGVRDDDFTSPLQTGPSYTFTRKFEKAGSYDFVCQIHTLMKMKVDVTP